MTTTLHFDIRPQPDNTTCGPTCLHAVYRYFGDPIALSRVIADVPMLESGGTLSVYLANHALRRGYQTTIIPYNLQIFDPTWSHVPPGDIAEKLRRRCAIKQGLPGFEGVTDAYLDYLQFGGRLKFEVLTAALIRKYLNRGIPITAGLSATYLYNSPREYDVDDRVVYDDVRGEPAGHFVVLTATTGKKGVPGRRSVSAESPGGRAALFRRYLLPGMRHHARHPDR